MLHHEPVLPSEVLSVLQPAPGETVLDVTLGLGGHSQLFLQKIGPQGRLIALDADAGNLDVARERLAAFIHQTTLYHVNFSAMEELHLPPVDVLFADLGLSSPHVDDPERGFSFRYDSPLDLRFDQSMGETAAELLERCELEDIIEILRMYGELYKDALRIARVLTEMKPQTTADLRLAVEKACGWRAKQVLPQVFQALRIAVNDELRALGVLLAAGPKILAPGGRMGVLSYHSLEDRMVKQVFRDLCEPEKDVITGKISVEAPYRLLTKKAMQASEEEVRNNPRSRSVKFRAIERRK